MNRQSANALAPRAWYTAFMPSPRASMIRVALAGHLALMAAFGPWACCCAPARLVGWWLAAPAPAGCCQHGPAPDRVPPPCPCKDGLVLVLATAPLRADGAAPAGEAEAFDLPTPAGPAPSAPPAGLDEGLLPFLSARDRLRAHHVLRC